MSMDELEKNHFFELNSANGVLTVCIDEGKHISYNFTTTIKINIAYNTTEMGLSRAEVEDNFSMNKRKRKLLALSTVSKHDGGRGVRKRTRDKSSTHQQLKSKNLPKISQGPKSPKVTQHLRVRFESKSQRAKRLTAKEKRKKELSIEIEGAQKNENMESVLETQEERNDDTFSVDEESTQEQTTNSEKKEIVCKYCQRSFSRPKPFFDHRRTPESNHKCKVCGKTEPYKAHLIVHMQRHNNETSSFSKASKQSMDLEQIGKGAHGKDTARSSGSVPKKTNSGKKKEQMQCTVCNMVVSSEDSLKIHTMLHTGECPYRCCVCDKMFSSLSSREYHMDSHLAAGRFRCNPCGQRFESRAELAKHQLTHEIKCPLCGVQFPNKTSRTCHYRTQHTDEILKCSLCSNLFPTQEELDRHMIYHKKGKKEQCPTCGVMVHKLKDHMQLHMQKPEEKQFACDQCPMRYLRKSNLERHMLIHTGEKPYACSHCPRRFRGNGMLHKHLLTHTLEKPFQCDVCGKRFALKSNLAVHMRTHSNDKPFKCPVCPQCFNHKNSLLGHISSKHAQEVATLREEHGPSLGGDQPDPHLSSLPPFTMSSVVESVPNHHTQPTDMSDVYLDIGDDSTSKATMGISNHNLLSLMDQHRTAHQVMVSGSHLTNLALTEKLDPALAAVTYLQGLSDKSEMQLSKGYNQTGCNQDLNLTSSMLLDADKMFSGKYGVEPQPDSDY